jgi:hypothetical protein
MNSLVQGMNFEGVKLFPTPQEVQASLVLEQLNKNNPTVGTNTNPHTWEEFNGLYETAFGAMAMCLKMIKELNQDVCENIPERDKFLMYLRQLHKDHSSLLQELQLIYEGHKDRTGLITESDEVVWSFQVQHTYAVFHSRIAEVLVPLVADILAMYMPFHAEVTQRAMELAAQQAELPVVSPEINNL